MKEIVLNNKGYWDLDRILYENTEEQIAQEDSSSKIQCIKIDGRKFYKKYFDGNIEDFDEKIEWYNSILLPCILKQFDLNHARYFLAIEKGKKFLLSPSFLKEGERLILGDDILGDAFLSSKENIGIDEKLEKIKEYLQKKGASTEEIQEVQLEHLKQIFAVKFLGVKNFHAGNWGLIENENGEVVRTCPFMDYESACIEMKNEAIDEDIWENFVLDGKRGLEDFIKYYEKFPEFKEFVQEAYKHFSLRKALEDSYEETHCEIDMECVYYYNDFFNQRMKCLRDILNSCKQKEMKGEEEK